MDKITSQKQYNWKRYWVKRGGNINLSDGDGFLYDPDSEYGDIFNPDAMSFDTINNIPCLVLLGEPGIGKSYTIKTHVDKLKKDGEEPFFLDLRSFGSEDRLIDKLFKSDIFVRWVKGEHNLHLYLDSLDECLLQIKTLAALLIDELQGYPVERLFLRITCRTAEWPEMLEDGLKKLWGKEAVDVYQLAPLRRVDVKVAAEARNIDPETFLNEIEIKEAHPFANKPVTLEFLLTAFQTTGQFPANRTELYLQGCRLLCDELNLNRRSAGFTGNLAPEQRLIVAARVAALTMFSNRYAISTDPGMRDIPEEDLSMKDLTGGYEDVLGEHLEINETIIHEALSTGLFISCGPSRMRWAHQTYAEYLAARYLYIHNMTIPQVMSLLTHPGDDGKLVPQLYETSAWLAAMRPEIFREIAKIDAEVLLRGDVATTEACRRKLLVDCLLKLLNEEKLPRFDWRRRNLYRKLFHPALAEQLLPLLQNSTASISAKVASIQITHFCEVQPLYGTLADIALNDTESIDIRVEAAYTLAKVGDENSRSRLKPLASKEFSEDTEDQLKGCVLQALWPDYLSAHELFNVLTFPKCSNFTGAYDIFIRKRLPQHLKPEHLPVALEWVEKQGEHKFRLPTYHIFGELIDKIMLKAWEYFDQEGISEVFSRLTLEYLADSDYRSHAENTTLRNAIKKNKNKRRKLLIGLLPFISYPERKDISHMIYYSSKIILPEDVPWILEYLKKSQSQAIQRKLAELIKYVFPYNDLELISEILKACTDNEIVDETFSRIFKAVRLDSPEAQKMKADHYKEQVRQKRTKEPPLLEPSPRERVALCLEKFESGNLFAWGRLTMEITLEPRSTHYDSISKVDLTSFPGWENADSETRRRIIEAARNYILNGDPEKSKWFNKGKYYGPAIAGYKAFSLLLREKPDFVYNFPQAVWKKWVCVIYYI